MSERLGLAMRVVATLLLIGICVELVRLSWHHPVSFVFSVVAGGVGIAAGSLVFLYNIVAVPRPKQGA